VIFGGRLSVYVQKNGVDIQSNQRLNALLMESEKAIREGNREQAYELSLQATKIAPENIEA
jgi:hypothetical protein